MNRAERRRAGRKCSRRIRRYTEGLEDYRPFAISTLEASVAVEEKRGRREGSRILRERPEPLRIKLPSWAQMGPRMGKGKRERRKPPPKPTEDEKWHKRLMRRVRANPSGRR